MMPTQVELVDGDSLDYDAYITLQREAYAELLTKSKVSDAFMTSAYYRWKYHPPAGAAKIALVRDGEGLVAATAMVPVNIRLQGESVLGWQDGDVATAPRARGKGLFLKCLRALTEAHMPDTVLFAFPNKNSIGGFDKLGWRRNQIVTTWINPLTRFRNQKSANVREIHLFDDGQDRLAESLVDCEKTLVFRSSHYMNWRYTDKPAQDYTLFAYQDGREQLGCAVARTARVMGRNLTLLMELWGIRPSVERALLLHVSAWAREQLTAQVVMLDTGMPLTTALTAGYAPVRAFLLPKKQILVSTAVSGQRAERAEAGPWRVQMGDWDSF